MENTIITLTGSEEHRPRPPFDAAYDKGAIAAAAGDAESDCPYQDKRTDRGSVTFSRAWRKAWLKGFRGVHAGDIDVHVETERPALDPEEE